MKRIKTIIYKTNISRNICEHLIGKHHTNKHRMCVGCIIMLVGVLIAKIVGSVQITVIHFAADMFGYLIHGIGAIPFVETILKEENA